MGKPPYPSWPRPPDYPCKRPGFGWFPSRVTENVAWPPLWNWKRVNFDDDPLKGEGAQGFMPLIFIDNGDVAYQPQKFVSAGAVLQMGMGFDSFETAEGFGYNRRCSIGLVFSAFYATFREMHLTDPPDFEPISWYREGFTADLVSRFSETKVEEFRFEPANINTALVPGFGTLTNRTELSCAIA